MQARIFKSVTMNKWRQPSWHYNWKQTIVCIHSHFACRGKTFDSQREKEKWQKRQKRVGRKSSKVFRVRGTKTTLLSLDGKTENFLSFCLCAWRLGGGYEKEVCSTHTQIGEFVVHGIHVEETRVHTREHKAESRRRAGSFILKWVRSTLPNAMSLKYLSFSYRNKSTRVSWQIDTKALIWGR